MRAQLKGLDDEAYLLHTDDTALSLAGNSGIATLYAVYDFLVRWMEVERSVGRIYFLAGPEERDTLFQRAEEFFRARGVTPPSR